MNPMDTIYVVNESTKLSDKDAWTISWGLDYQLRFHFGRAGWRSDLRASFVPGGAKAKIPAGGAVLHMLDTADVQGALGYHDEDGNEVPFARVFVATALADGQTPSSVASHEALELAADPHVNLCALTGDGSRLYAVEVGDPVQGTDYDLYAPIGRTSGLTVANFATPAYFDPNTKAERVDFRGALSAPFTIAPQGYMSYVDMSNASAGWTQVFGAERTTPPPPDGDDRVGRRVAIAQ